MKTIILLILSAFTAFAATTYPVLTDNPARTFSGGGTNLVLLNTSQTWTGTPTFPAAFYRSNGITTRTLFSTNSIYIPTITNSTAYPTNAGDFTNITALVTIPMPALVGTNSTVNLFIRYWPTNAVANSTGTALYAGDNMQYVWSQNNSGNANGISLAGGALFKNSRAMTNQVRLVAGAGGPSITTWNTFTTTPGHFLADTSTNGWLLKIGLFSASAATTITNMWVEEIYATETITQ